MTGNQDINVGDLIIVTGYKNCKCGWSNDMKGYVGKETRVAQKTYSYYHKANFYKIDADRGCWWWDDSCISPAYDLPDLPGFCIAEADDLNRLFL